MMSRIRAAMATTQLELLTGIVEMDKTCFVGKTRKSNDKDDDAKLV